MMRLTDVVTVLSAPVLEDTHGNEVQDWTNPTTVATLPAEVSYTTVATVTEGGRNALIEELRAITPPYPFDASTQRIAWRGRQYAVDGPPMVRRRHGADHHLTIPLRDVVG